MKKQLIAFVLTALLGVVVPQARAAVVISNLDPNNPAFGLNSPQIGQSMLNGNRTLSLTSVQFDQDAGLTPSETVSVFSRNGDGTLGTTLFSGFTVGFNSISGVTTATPTSTFLLLPNTGYYFVLNSNSSSNLEWTYTSSTDYASAFGATIPANNSSFYRSGGNTLVYRSLTDGPQMIQVNASVVPEPMTSAFIDLAMVGGAVMFIVRRRRRLA